MKVTIDGVNYAPIVQKELNGNAISALDVVFYSRDLQRDLTVRDYLYTLLLTLWKKQEGFGGKRPFGNSGWDYDLYVPLIKAGYIAGAVDDMGLVEEVDKRQAHEFVADLIALAFYGAKGD